MTRGRAIGRGLAAGALAGLVLACSAADGERRRVTIIGIDGATPRLVESWMDAGVLPNLAGLAADGAWGRLRSHAPMLSPRIWTSIATGKSPANHGIHNWVLKLGGGRLRLYTSSDRRGAALWTIASAAGLRVGVVNWLMTHPPEKIDGVVISGYAVPGQQAARESLARSYAQAMVPGSTLQTDALQSAEHAAYPAAWARRFAELAAQHASATTIEDSALLAELESENVRAALEPPFSTDSLVTDVAVAVAREEDPDILMVLLTGIDRVSHFLWAGLAKPERYPEASRLDPGARADFRRALRAYYTYSDGLVGRILAERGSEGLVLVVSDHGFEAVANAGLGTTGGHISERAINGVVFARGRGFDAGGGLHGMSVDDITPTVLAWLGLPLARDMQGKPAAEIEPRVPAVASYDDLGIERVVTGEDGSEQRIIDELRSLGYVEASEPGARGEAEESVAPSR